MEDAERLLQLLRVVEVWTNFDIQIDITLAIFWEKLQNYILQKAHRKSPKTRQHLYQ